MRGRQRRAVEAAYGAKPLAFALLVVYSPRATAAALAVGMGAAAAGSGAGMVRLPDGRQMSAVSRSVDSVLGWAGRNQQRYAHLPGRVLAVVIYDAVVLHEWTLAQGLGKVVATWPRGSYSASERHSLTDQSVRVTLPDGKVALLSGARGPMHADVGKTLRAIATIATGQQNSSTATSSAGPKID